MKYFSVFLVLAITGLFKCSEEDELPPISKEGRSTFGCMVNGKLWLTEGSAFSSNTHAEIYRSHDTIAVNIYANGRSQTTMFMSIIAVPALKINEPYHFINNDECCGLQYLDFTGAVSCAYELPISGHVTLSRWDEGEGILAGTFQFSAESDECPGTVVITEGRFDIGEIVY